MKVNGFYLLVGALFCAMLFISLRFFRGIGHASVGIAYAKGYTITAEKPAVVKAVNVVPGQEIKEGQLLVELSSNDLEMEIERLTQRIAVLESEQIEKKKAVNSRIALIRAETGVKIEELNTDIAETESDLRLNRQLTKSHQLSRDSTADQPMLEKINALKQQRARHEEAITVRSAEIVRENETEQFMLENEIKLLRKELDLLTDQKKKLNKYATAPGVVESVYVRAGEQIGSYSPIMSVNPLHPTAIVGYLVGRKEPLPVGSAVTISSYERPRFVTTGKIIGYGSVVQLPDILQKSTAVRAFGREVFIESPAENTLAAGEKVLIK